MERMTHSTNSHPNCAACQAPYTWVVEILCHLQRVGHMHSAKPPSKEWRWLRGCCGDYVLPVSGEHFLQTHLVLSQASGSPLRCIYLSSVCMSVYLHVCMCAVCRQCPRRGQEKGIRTPGTGAMDSCKLPCGRWGPNLGPLQEREVLEPAESSV